MEYTLINPINPNLSAIEQVLINRGFTQEEIPRYLNLTKQDNLSPLLLNNIDRAVQLIIKHISKEDNSIALVVDPDCDGFTSSAFLLNYLHKVFPTSVNKISYFFHTDKTHGIEGFDFLPNTSLVIAPDSSSNEYDTHKALNDKGIDVLVIDHHQADYISPYACVVNNQLCDYPNKALSGVGVVYKVCQRLDQLMETTYAEDYIDLVMLGLIGDMMDLRSYETKYLVKQGLANIRNPFIKGMAEKNAYSIGPQLTPIGVAFYIVPLINAVTRVGSQSEKELLFTSMLEWRAFNLVPSTKKGCSGQTETLVEQAVRTCTNVKNRQTRLQDAAVEAIENYIKEKNLLDHKLLIIKLDDRFKVDSTIRGVIANKFMAKYCRPVALLTLTDYENGKMWAGSARGYEKSKLKDFRQFCRDSGLIIDAQGHPNAFGLMIDEEKIDEFITYADETLKEIEFSSSYKVDFIYTADSVNPKDILDIGSMKSLWGQNINEALVVVERINITKNMVSLMSRDKNPTLKIQLQNGVTCIKFKSSEEEFESFLTDTGCVTITIVGKCEVNRYFNNETPQIIVEDYEILNRQEYYF